MANTTNLLEALSAYQGDQASLNRFVETAKQELGENWSESIYQTLPNLPSGLKEKLDHAFQYHGASLSWTEIQSYLTSTNPLDIPTVSSRVDTLSYWLQFFGEAGKAAVDQLKEKLEREKELLDTTLQADLNDENQISSSLESETPSSFEEEDESFISSTIPQTQEESFSETELVEPTHSEEAPFNEETFETGVENNYSLEEEMASNEYNEPYPQDEYFEEEYLGDEYPQEEYITNNEQYDEYIQEGYEDDTIEYQQNDYQDSQTQSDFSDETNYINEHNISETYDENLYSSDNYQDNNYYEENYVEGETSQNEYYQTGYETEEPEYASEEYENETTQANGSIEDIETPFWRTPVYEPEKAETNEEFMAKKVFHQLDFLSAVRCWVNARCIALGNKEIYSYRHYGFLIDVMEESKKDLEVVLASPTFYPAIEQIRPEGLKQLQSALKSLESDLQIAYDNLPSELTDLISDSTQVADVKRMLGSLDTSNKPELLGVAPDGFEMLDDPFAGMDLEKNKITSSQNEQNGIQKKKTFSFNKKTAS